MRRGHMMGVRAFADSSEAHRGFVLAQQEGGAGFADIDARAIDTERVAALRGNRIESSEAPDGGLAQRIGTADERGVSETGADQAASRREHFRARRAGRGDGVDGTAKVEKPGDKIRQGAGLLLSVMKGRGPAARTA